ncbi:hypothetical protein Tco_1429273 [Tanacetum coccineum]
MEDEHLDTIPATESDEFIKSSAENLVPTPSDSEDASDGECDLLVCDDFPKSHLVTFSNPLFDIDDDCTSSDDESFSEEDVPMENFKSFSNPLFDLYEEIISTEVNLIQNKVLESTTSIPPGIDSFDAESNLIESLLNQNTLIDSSSKIDSLLDEFVGELTLLKPIPPGFDDDNLDPEGEIHLSFSPSPIPVEDSDSLMEEIDVFLASDGSIPPGIESDDYDSEDDDNSTSLPEFESFHVDYPDSGDSTIDVVIYDPGICIEVESTRFLATHSPVIDTLLLFSSKNKDKVFNHGVLASKEKSPPSSSHRGFKASKLFHHKSPDFDSWRGHSYLGCNEYPLKDKNEAKIDKTEHGIRNKRDADMTRNGDDSHDSGGDGRRRMPVARECTYTDFLKCQPLNFKGTEGVVGLTQWIEKMESVFHLSNCIVACQIKFATCTLQGNALTW